MYGAYFRVFILNKHFNLIGKLNILEFQICVGELIFVVPTH